MNNALCGRTGPTPSENNLENTLSRMSQRLGMSQGVKCGILSQASSGIAISNPDIEEHIAAAGPLLSAYCGNPYWSRPDLAELALATSFANSILVAHNHHGTKFLSYLHGPFAVALINSDSNEALVAIDRMGVYQLYFSHNPDASLVFGSTAGSLQAHGGFPAQLSQQSLFDYLYFHMVPSPGSVFENQRKLRPGQYLRYRDESTTCVRYWSPEFVESSTYGRRDLEVELKKLLRQSIQRCVSGEQAGCFLSGGVDSSTVAGILAELRPGTKTFTIGFKEKGYDETEFARLTASHFKTDQIEYFVSPSDVVDILPEIANSYDEPFGNSSVVPTYYCAKLARENGIRTLLAGDGGDELFGGNIRYVTQNIFGIYEKVPSLLKSIAIEPLAFKLPNAGKFPPTRKLQSYIRQAKVPMPDRLETYNYFFRTSADEILHPNFLTSINVDAPIALLRTNYNSSNADSTLNKMLELDWKFTLADNDLRKVSRMCELAGVQVRYPFLDDDLVEFSARVPPELKIHHFKLRHFYKRAMRNFLPRSVLRKSKHGFGLPFGIWMNSFEPLQDLAYGCLSDIGKRSIINPAYLDKLIQSHRSDHAHYYGEFIWVLMMLELWLKNHDRRTGGRYST